MPPTPSTFPATRWSRSPFSSLAWIDPVQVLAGAGLLGIATPIAAERVLSGTGGSMSDRPRPWPREGVGASLSNVVAGWLADIGGYGLACRVRSAAPILAFAVFLRRAPLIAPARPDIGGDPVNAAVTPS